MDKLHRKMQIKKTSLMDIWMDQHLLKKWNLWLNVFQKRGCQAHICVGEFSWIFTNEIISVLHKLPDNSTGACISQLSQWDQHYHNEATQRYYRKGNVWNNVSHKHMYNNKKHCQVKFNNILEREIHNQVQFLSICSTAKSIIVAHYSNKQTKMIISIYAEKSFKKI